jgi:serine/threonine protein kinase
MVYAAPEVAHYEKRNTAADVWSLGCVFMEMATVLKGETIAGMRSFLQMRTGNYRFYANIEILGQWARKLRDSGAEKDNTVFKWVRAMLDKDADERPTASELYDDIVRECSLQHVPFCGSCCVEDVDSSGIEDEDEDDLWEKASELTIMPETA